LSLNDSSLFVFESELRENFLPLTYTKLGASLLFGTGTFLEHIEANFSSKATNLLVPSYLQEYTKEEYPEIGVNQSISSSCTVINSLVSHRPEFWKFMANALNEPQDFLFVDQSGIPVFGKLDSFDLSKLKLDGNLRNHRPSKIAIKPLSPELAPVALVRHPWELVRDNPEKIELDASRQRFSSQEGFSSNRGNDLYIRGSRVSIAESADFERYVTIDATKGPVVIDKGAEVQSFSHIAGPCYIGKNVKVRSARIREGTTVGATSKVAGEVEASIIAEYSNKSHDGFIGHSILGSWVNLGALTTCSDLKNTYGTIRVKSGRKLLDTGQIKVGVFLADMSKTSIGALLSSGTRVGVSSQVFGSVSRDVPSFTMYGKSLGARSSEVILESALSTQKRMMERRGLKMSGALGSLIRSVYKMTKGDRAFQRVTQSRFKLP
jgi:UDP-N-acetylglucosamine diphosphorylase / glucose-1-phosphate thymidylyltransferase / UDP-N-acetylgalactosamine diphosphorylase / glucosamine-1-phosphate N-acetyltransferase / galactosamine-1-phosphate N-acetyltransferase